MSDELRGHPPRRSDPNITDANAGPSFEGMPYAALRRYITGTSDAVERRRIEAWAGASPARRAYLSALGRTWARTEGNTEPAATDAAWAALSAQLDVPQTDVSPAFVAPWEEPVVEVDVRRRRPSRLLTGAFESRRRWTVIPVAAAAALLAAVGTFLLQGPARGWLTPEPSVSAAEREVATGVGQRAEIKLGDGSVVTLASKSRLRFPADFGVRNRELWLEGKAHFSVVHDATRPFAVHAAGSKTVDIGTEFVLLAYPEDELVQVVVAEGSVAFGADGPGAPAPAVLTEGRMGQLAPGAAAPSIRQVDPSAYTGWLTGRLVFDNTPLTEVAAELGRWYDVQIRFADPSLAHETFTASFTAESFSETLRTLITVLRLRAERQGKTVVLHRRIR